MSAHGRYILAVVVAKQGIGEPFAISGVFHLVAGVEMANLYHLLACTPIDEACRSHIVIYSEKDILNRPVGVVNQHLAELDVCRQRVIVHLYGGKVAASGIVVGTDALVIDDMAQTRLLHHDGSAVVNGCFVLGCSR